VAALTLVYLAHPGMRHTILSAIPNGH
jgi:hypothetical protein